MSFDESTQTMNVGRNDWLEASKDKDMQIRSYLTPVGSVRIAVRPAEQDTQIIVTGYELPVLAGEEYENTRLTERLNEAYQDYELEPEEKELLDLAAEQFGRRLSGEE
jgi:transcription antitermination factor NusA-like protein